jgi:bacterioferritin
LCRRSRRCSQEDALARTERYVALRLVALYKPVGGGWETAATAPEASAANRDHHDEKGGQAMSARGAFLSDIKEIRRRAREHLSEGAVTQNYGGKVEDTVALLNHAVATEIVCILRYKFHAVCATGLASEAVKEEFAQHAKEEEEHLDLLAERINQLGGKPNLNPDGVGARAASEYAEGENLIDMIKEDLVAERIAIDSYGEIIRYLGDRDPTTKRLMEIILAKEEEHADDMANLLARMDKK